MITPVLPKSDKIIEVYKKGGFVFLKSEHSLIRLGVYSEDVIRLSYTENESFDEKQGQGMLLEELTLLSDSEFSVKESADEIRVETKSLIIRVNRMTGSLKDFKLTDGCETAVFSEAEEGSHIIEKFDVYRPVGQIKTEEVKTADGVKKRVLAADKEYVESLYHTTTNFAFAEDEKLFGLGQAEEGVWNLRGTTQYLHQANKKIAIPFLISSKGYGLLFTSQSPAVFNDTQYGSYFYTNADYYLDYFLIAPDNCGAAQTTVFSRIIARMRMLTGKATLPPDFALG